MVTSEQCARSEIIKNYRHPLRAIYLLGFEDMGLSKCILEKCYNIVALPGNSSINIAVASSMVMFDRVIKIEVGE